MVSKKEYDCFNLGWFVSSLPCSSNLLALVHGFDKFSTSLTRIGCAVILCWQYYMGRGTCKFGASCNFHHPKQGGSSGCPANLITNGIVAVTIKVAAMGLDPSKHLGKEITFVHNCICSYMGVVYVAKEGNMKH
ncbi:unnamed protein product [Prunus armeniaca]